MIVKNESHLIVNTLKQLTRHIQFDYWAINDNGSTDGTQDLIRGFFKEVGIPGILDETPWQDFAFNRTLAFKAAFGKTDYAFVWDADDEIHGDFRLPEDLTADVYNFIFGNATGSRYSRRQLFKNTLRWKYVGVLHEFPDCEDKIESTGNVAGNYFFLSGRGGARNRDPDKYLKDALILEKAFNEAYAKKDGIYNRYAFYTAQSYSCCGRHEKAIEFYKKVLTLENWSQEKYVSCLEIYEMYCKIGKDEEGLRFLIESFRHDKKRVECIYRLIKHYCIKELPEVAFAYYSLIQKYYENEYVNDNIANRLFAKKDEYDFYLPYYMVIVCERIGRLDVYKKMYEMIFRQNYLHAGAWWIHNLYNNLQFGVPVGSLDYLESTLMYADNLRRHGTPLNEAHYVIVDKMVQANRAFISAPCEVQIDQKNQVNQVRVMLTVTTCKRLSLFEETINSMKRNWKDISAVDYFFCVDDNSSEEDRTTMQTKYPFFDYHMKGPTEKGHRESMNIIWNKLKEIQPTYWIHMEDDWLYFKQENYVTRAIALLEKYESQNIHQLVFNREYGLMLKDMNRTSVEPLESGVVIHSQKPAQGPNCAYWPHYSLQPSIVRTKAILELGNYDSPNTFFERDYANKYGAAGYKTIFYDGVYSLHIGKQHWEKDGQNAYALNGVGQFAKDKDKSNPSLVITEMPSSDTGN
jgi:tetratricopeptide (TPR) repeat protein